MGTALRCKGGGGNSNEEYQQEYSPLYHNVYTQNDIDNWANIVARSLRAAGGTPKDKIHVAYGYGLFTGGLGAHYGAERLGATVIPMSGGQTFSVRPSAIFSRTHSRCTA